MKLLLLTPARLGWTDPTGGKLVLRAGGLAGFHLTNLTTDQSENISLELSEVREKQRSIKEYETLQFKSYLLSIGIEDPITRASLRES